MPLIRDFCCERGNSHGSRRTCTDGVLPDGPGHATISQEIHIATVIIAMVDGRVRGERRLAPTTYAPSERGCMAPPITIFSRRQPQRNGARWTCTHGVLPNGPGHVMMSKKIHIAMVIITTADGHVRSGAGAGGDHGLAVPPQHRGHQGD